MKLASCHLSGAWNSVAATGFLENLWMLMLNIQGLHSVGPYRV